MTWLLDTNACIDYLRSGSGSKVAEHLAEKNAEDIVLCSVVRAELLFGALDEAVALPRTLSKFAGFCRSSHRFLLMTPRPKHTGKFART